MKLRTLKRQWLEYLERERGRSAKTLENYDRYLERFFTFAKAQKATELTEKLIENYRVHLAGQANNDESKLTVRTRNYHLSALRQFLVYLRGRGFTELSPQVVVREQEEKESRERSPEATLARLLASPEQKTPEEVRDRAVLFVLASTGVRVSELCALEVGDVDLTRGELLVAAGTKRERTVFLSDEARVAAASYLDSRADSHPALFLRTGRKQNDGGDPRLIPRQVERLIKKYAAKAGITTPVTPQLIRNTCIATLIKDGVDLPTVRALMGHEHLKSTEVYARCEGDI